MRASKQVRTLTRWREQVARLIALAEPVSEHLRGGDIERSVMKGRGALILGGGSFDVALTRAYAERLIAEGERLELERAVFADWTRTRGMGPENREPGAFVLDQWSYVHTLPVRDRLVALGWDAGTRVLIGATWVWPMALRLSGGWPGPLAREWGTVRCEACEGNGARIGTGACRACGGEGGQLDDGERDQWAKCEACDGQCGRETLVRCKPCKGRGYVKHPTREAAAANGGAWMIRAGRRLLAAIEGQPSECPDCVAKGRSPGKQPDTMLSVNGGPMRPGVVDDRCPSCRGTGHNLAGTLPAFVFAREAYDAHVLAWHMRRRSERQASTAGLDYSDLRELVGRATLDRALENAATIAGLTQHANETTEQFRSRVLAYVRGH